MPDPQKHTDYSTPQAKRKLARKITRIGKKAGWDYDDWTNLTQFVRKALGLTKPVRARPLPNILTDEQLVKYWAAVDASGNAQHALMLRILYYTGVRVAELVNMRRADVDLKGRRIRINEGKGLKDRYVLFPESLRLPLSLHLDSLNGDWLWKGRQGALTDRRVRQIVVGYAESIGVHASPHTFRHQAITQMTRSGMNDAQIQLLSGHSSRKTLEIYQHLALPDVQGKYDEAMGQTPKAPHTPS